MKCPMLLIPYIIQPGDNFYKLARQFNTTIDVIIAANPTINSNYLYIGQRICIPVPQSPNAVIAYKATRPILVNDKDINVGLYPVLNYKPEDAQYPYIYVPIAEFERVGAKVAWNEQEQLLTVTTDYYLNKNTIAQQQNEIKELQNKISDFEEQIRLCKEKYVKYEGIVDSYYKFSKSYWKPNIIKNGLTIGKVYEVIGKDVAMGKQYMTILNDNNEEYIFYVSKQASPRGIIYVGKVENGIYEFTWEAENITEKFKILKPSDEDTSLTPGSVYVAEINYGIQGYEGKAYSIVGTDIVITPIL